MSGNFVVKTLQGLEEVLAEEIKSLGGIDVKIGNRAVSCKGDLALGYRLNYLTRTALAVLRPIRSGQVRNEQELYDLVKSIKWFELFQIRKTILVNVACYSTLFRNTHFLALKSKDAIVDQFREKYNRRPSVSKEADVKIDIYIKDDICTVSLDLSGQSLFKRGYRLNQGTAPINEVLAAGLLKLAGWQSSTPLVDPMCGSGTIPIEAAMMAENKPSQFLRDDFSFMHHRDFNRKVWKEVISTTPDPVSNDISIEGSDIDGTLVRIARSNALNADIQSIEWKTRDFFTWRPQGPPGLILFNPPYDKRLALDDANEFYIKIGNQLKFHFAGWKAFIISSHLQAVKRVGLKPFVKINLFNGPLECKLVGFDLY